MLKNGGMSATAAEKELKGTVAADKNEILFSRFQINYNDEPQMYRKGSVAFRESALEEPPLDCNHVMVEEQEEASTEIPESKATKTQVERMRKAKGKARIVVEHMDIIKDEFWERRPWILTGKPGRVARDGS